MKKRQIDAQNERRQARVEINLMGEEDPGPRSLGKSLGKRRTGCSLPFLGLLVALPLTELVRALLG